VLGSVTAYYMQFIKKNQQFFPRKNTLIL